MAFQPFIKSDTGFLRTLFPNNAFAWSDDTSPYIGGGLGGNSAYPTNAQLQELDIPSGSLMHAIDKNTYSQAEVNSKLTLFGFYLYNNGVYTNTVYRLNILKKQYTSALVLDVYDILNNTVINSHQISANIYSTLYGSEGIIVVLRLTTYNGRPCLQGAVGYQDINLKFWRFQDSRFIMMLDYGSGSIIPSGNTTKVTIISDPNEQDPGGTSGESGGEGDFDPTSDIITRPSISVINGLASMNAGFVTLYKVTMADLQLLASYLYTDDIWQIVNNYFSHPSEMIAGLLLVPVAVTTGAAYRPKVGLHTFNINLPIVSQQYYEIDMGNITISEYYGSCFDYAPYTQIEIYLPFIGTRSLDVDEIMGKTLHLSYRIDVMNGDCVATISYYDGLNRSVHYEFSGNCGQQIPVSAQNMDAVVQNAIAFATTAVTAIAGAAGAGAAAAGAATEAGATAAEVETISTAAQASANLSAAGDIAGAGVGVVMNSKAHIERTGNIGSGLGLLSVLTPYIVKKVPRQSLPDNYASFEGYPANLYGTLADFSGYTVVDEIKLQNISATDGEIAEIYNILKGGVYV